jgi:hypothetical protein
MGWEVAFVVERGRRAIARVEELVLKQGSRLVRGREARGGVCLGAGQSAAMPATTRKVLDRRRLLAAGGAAAALLIADRLAGAWPAPAQRSGYPFTLGVASGDPAPGGVVLWTRLAPQPLLPDGGIPARTVLVDWQIAADPRFRRIVRGGTVLATPAQAHAVHVEVEGLEPARPWWYRFRAGGELSPVGQTRTLPAPGASPGQLALAVVSCQHYEHGYYTAYRHLAQEDLDLVLHLGDYLYESAPADGQPRRHVGPAPTDLAGYRLRHALYRTDPDLQAAHAALPFLLTWDDHEVANDYAADRSERFDPPAAFRRRRAAAYQAYWEHLPLRRRSRPRGRRRGSIGAYGLVTWPSWLSSIPGSTATTSPVMATGWAAARSWPGARSGWTRGAACSGPSSGAGCWPGWTAPGSAGTWSPSSCSWPSWTSSLGSGGPMAAMAGTAMPPTGPASWSF